MQALDTIRARLDAADDLAAVMGAAWDAFELTRFVAHAYSSQHTSGYAMWMYAIPPACDGRDVLGFAPSVPDGSLVAMDLADLDGFTEYQSADELAALAMAVAAKLHGIVPAAVGTKDANACLRAAQAAETIRGLLIEDA